MTNADSYPCIVNPAIRHSQKTTIEGDDDEGFRSWQTAAMRDGYERTKSLYRSWSDCYESDEYKSFRNKNPAPLNDRYEQRSGISKGRDSDFYGFYDDIFREHGAEAPPG
jgi:hypothetical protein